MPEQPADRIARYEARIARPVETMDEIAQRVAEGETLMAICKAWGVPYSRIVRWITVDVERSEQYAAALRFRADALIAETIPIADQPTRNDAGEPDNPRDKLRIDTRFRAAAKWDPQRFGEAEAVRSAPVRSPSTVPMLEAARRVAFALAQGAQLVEQERQAPRLLEAPAEPSEPAEQ